MSRSQPLSQAHLSTLREVLDYQIGIAREWLDMADEKMVDPESDLRQLREYRDKVCVGDVPVTPNDLSGVRGWVQTHLDEFVREWVADYPDDETYRAMQTRVEALLAALA